MNHKIKRIIKECTNDVLLESTSPSIEDINIDGVIGVRRINEDEVEVDIS